MKLMMSLETSLVEEIYKLIKACENLYSFVPVFCIVSSIIIFKLALVTSKPSAITLSLNEDVALYTGRTKTISSLLGPILTQHCVFLLFHLRIIHLIG